LIDTGLIEPSAGGRMGGVIRAASATSSVLGMYRGPTIIGNRSRSAP
jgi:hypothetical protein